MINDKAKQVVDFLNGRPRNRLVIHNSLSLDYTVDLGYLIAGYYNSLEFDVNTADLEDWLEKKVIQEIYLDKDFGYCLSISNLAFLLEPNLRFNFIHFIDKVSRNNTLFIDWPGTVNAKTLYFISTQEGITIDISQLSALILIS